jgi:hypothetical protein
LGWNCAPSLGGANNREEAVVITTEQKEQSWRRRDTPQITINALIVHREFEEREKNTDFPSLD